MIEQRITLTTADRRGAFLAIVIAVLLHICFIRLPGINLEWVFADGAKYFADHNPVFLKHYFFLEANTLGMPFMGYLTHRVLPFLSYNAALRILSAASFVLIGYSLLKLHSLMQRSYHPSLLLLVVFLNPLVWTFGGRGTADLFPAALTLFAITLFWESDGSRVRLVLAIVAYGVAIALKYHAALLLPLIGLGMLRRPGARATKVLACFSLVLALILLIPGLYILLARWFYGFWVVPPKFRVIHGLNLDLATFVMNLIAYAAYLCVLLLPYSVVALSARFNSKRKAIITLAAAGALFVVGAYGLRVEAEMRFGPLDAFINPRVYGGMFLVFAAISVLVSKEIVRNAKTQAARHYVRCILVGIVIFILVLSFTRPAQRYLLFVLPLAYLLLMNRKTSGKYVTGIAILIYTALIVFITLNQVATGSVVQKMMGQIAARGLLAATEPGDVIEGVAGDRFADQVGGAAQKHYIVVVGYSPNAIVTVESHPAPLVHKVLSLVPYQQISATTD